jgi:integrase/recombinase XerD
MTEKKMSDPIVEYHKFLKEIKGLSDRTIYHYFTYHRHLVNLPLDQENINSFIQSKNNNCVVRAYVKSYLDFLKRSKEFDLPHAKSGTIKKTIIRPISKNEIKAIREYSYNKSIKQGVIFDLLYYGALRRSEILTINTNSFEWEKWFDDPENFCLFKVMGKGKKERNVGVHQKAIKGILDLYLQKGLLSPHMDKESIIIKLNSIDDPLFVVTEWSIWNIVKKNSLNALNRDVRPHEIRHARATELLNNGATIRDIQQYLGHSTITTTEIYLHTQEKISLNRIIDISQDL